MVGAWAHGWSASRGVAPPVETAGGLRIDLGRPGGPARYVLLPAVDWSLVARLGRDCAAAGTEIKVAGESTALRANLGEGWRMYAPCTFMTSAFAQGRVDLPDLYTLKAERNAAVVHVTVSTGDGRAVASARLARSGTYGIVDRVETQPAHRRRGLATAMMVALGNVAVDNGLRAGLLSATAPGEALYRSLGWKAEGEIAGAIRREPGRHGV